MKGLRPTGLRHACLRQRGSFFLAAVPLVRRDLQSTDHRATDFHATDSRMRDLRPLGLHSLGLRLTDSRGIG